MLRRLHPEQPDSFAFAPDNQRWAEAQITKFPEGRQASAVIALLWRAQEQEGWLTRAAIEEVARMLGMPYMRALEVATFYFMFQLSPVGTTAHIQVCGTTSCMICGAEDLVEVCKRKIAKRPHELSEDGKFSWEEVECLGACANAPMAQIGKDYYEDLSPEILEDLIDRMADGEVPVPGSQKGRFASEPMDGKTVLQGDKTNERNRSVSLALEIGDTLKRIDGSEQPIRSPWNPATDEGARMPPPVNDDLLPPTGGNDRPTPGPQPGRDETVTKDSVTRQEPDADAKGWPDEGSIAGAQRDGAKPAPEDGNHAEAGGTDTRGGDGPLEDGSK